MKGDDAGGQTLVVDADTVKMGAPGFKYVVSAWEKTGAAVRGLEKDEVTTDVAIVEFEVVITGLEGQALAFLDGGLVVGMVRRDRAVGDEAVMS